MRTVQVDLQDGFQDDEVVVRLEGEEVARLAGVTTNLVISRAASAVIQAPEGPCALEVELPSRGLRASVSLDAHAAFVMVNATEGHLEAAVSPDEPLYL